MTKVRMLLITACVCLLSLAPVIAQTTNATVVGDVTDPQGGSIVGANIIVKNLGTGVTRAVSTSELGTYRVFPLNPGTYNVTAPALERMPVNGRNYTRLIMLMPGTSDQGGSQSNGTFSGTMLVAVNGQRRQDNNFTVDGVDNNFMMMNSPGGTPSMDAIQEFKILNNTSAEFGRSSGANVNIAIKSGTRNLHASVYEYLRNDKFDANDFFANRQGIGKLPFRQNQYGVAIGGP